MNEELYNPIPMSLTPDTTRELLDESAWLERLARRLVRDPGLAQDAVQDTLVAASERERRGEGPAPRGWLAKVLRNGLRQGLRARGRRAVHEELAGPDPGTMDRSALDIVSRLEVQRLLVEAVQDLHEPYRTAIALRFLEDLPPREVARRTKTPVKTVKTRIERGLDLLRRRLDTQTGGRERWLSALAPLGTRLAVPGLSLTTSGVLTMGLGWKLAGGAALTALVWFGMQAGEGEGGIERPAIAEAPRSATKDLAEVDLVGPEAAASLVVDANRQSIAPAAKPETPSPIVAGVPSFEGFVVDLEGRPVGGLRVSHVSTATGIWPPPEGEYTHCDASGRFELPVLSERGRLLADGKGFATLEPASYGGISPPEAPVIVVGHERYYAGVILDDSEEPLAGAELEIHLPRATAEMLREGALNSITPVQLTESDASGGFAFPPVGHVPGLLMRVHRDGFVDQTVELPDNSDDQVIVRMRRPAAEDGALAGHVYDLAGQPVEGAYVEAGGRAVRSDDKGAFVIDGAAAEPRVRAVARNHQPSTLELEGLSELERRALEITIGGPALSIEGRVVDDEGEPVAEALVWTFGGESFGQVVRRVGELNFMSSYDVEEVLGGYGSRESRTDEQGRFRLHGLQERDYDVQVLDPRSLARTARLAVAAGTQGCKLVLHQDERVERVAGVVVDSTGAPVADAIVRVNRMLSDADGELQHREAPRSFASHTDVQGRFAFAALAVENTTLLLNGEVIPSAQTLDLAGVEDLGAIVFRVPLKTHVRVFLDDSDLADSFELHDETDRTLNLTMMRGSVTLGSDSIGIENGESGLVQTDDSAATIVLFSQGLEVLRRKIELVGGEINELRF